MGPYYRNTSQGMGSFFEMFYQHPILMALFILGVTGVAYLVWQKKKSGDT